MRDGVQIDRRDIGDRVVLTVVGQVDVSTAAELRQALTEAQFGGATDVVVDIDGVEFLDSFGLGVFVGAVRRARSQGHGFRVACDRPRLRHLFHVARLDEIIEIVDSVDD
ncbi:MAG: STAS domain-containing protein [Nitriliruptoraceae bacterium]